MPDVAEVPVEALEDMYELLEGCTGGDEQVLAESIRRAGFKVHGTWDRGSSRWYEEYVMVFERLDDGKLFGADYKIGLTENQDYYYPWRDTPPKTMWRCPEVTSEQEHVLVTNYSWAK